MLDQLIQFDKELFLFLNNLGTPTWDTLWLTITNKLTFIPLYAVLLYLIFRSFGVKTLLLSILVITLMITFTDQITNLFKDGFVRFRPCHDSDIQSLVRLVKASCGGKYGFFSGHSSNSMAAAVFAGLLLKPYYKNLIFLLLFWSAMVAYSRIYVGVHFPLDIICGMTFGAISGYMFFKLIKYLQRNYFVEEI